MASDNQTSELSRESAQQELAELRQLINHHNSLYHQYDAPEIPDADYDKLFDRLIAIEEQFPDLVTPDSPSQRVGDAPLESFRQVTHDTPMMSLSKVFNDQDLADFEARILKRLDSEEVPRYSCEPKVDGVAVSLLYEHGLLVRGATRGATHKQTMLIQQTHGHTINLWFTAVTWHFFRIQALENARLEVSQILIIKDLRQ